MAAPEVLLYGPDSMQFQRYAGVRGSGLQLGRVGPTAGDGPNASGTDSLQRLPFGTQLILQDGRKYRFALAGGTALVIGDLQQSAANVANHVNTTAVASALGARSPSTTLGATAATADQYAGGYFCVSVTPGAGQVYLINDHAAAALSTDLAVNLAAGHAIRGAALTTTSRVDLIKHPYDGSIQWPTTITGNAIGVAVTALAAYVTAGTALAFGWLQTAGLASVLTQGTVVLGRMVIGSTTTAGSVADYGFTLTEGTPNVTDGTQNRPIVGRVQRVAATAAWSDVFLCIDH